MTGAEWRALPVFVSVTVLWATQGITGLDTTVICLAGACLLFLPKFGVIDWGDANKNVSWQVVLVAGGGISLGDILMRTGRPVGSPTAFSMRSACRCVDAPGRRGRDADRAGPAPDLRRHDGDGDGAAAHRARVGADGRVSPIVLALPAGMIIGGYPLLMFYNTLPNIIVYGTGALRVGDFPRVGIVLCIVACLLYAPCAATYWRWLGLFLNSSTVTTTDASPCRHSRSRPFQRACRSVLRLSPGAARRRGHQDRESERRRSCPPARRRPEDGQNG